MMYYRLLLLFAVGLYLGISPHGGSSRGAETLVHEIQLRHPVFRSPAPRSFSLSQVLDADGLPSGYFMPIRTEVCREGVCEIAQLTMYWDVVGQYQRLELPLGLRLTKLEHVPFVAADYKRLDEILRKRESILARYAIDDIAQGPEKTRVDGRTAATAAELEEEAVPDALYTSYTLWHWANGGVVEQMRRLTAARCSPPFIERLLKSEDREQTRFALNWIVDRQPTDPQFADAVFGVVDSDDRETVSLALRYLKAAVAEPAALHVRLLQLFHHADRHTRADLLEFMNRETVLEPAVLDGLTEGLDGIPYVELHAILRLLEKYKFHDMTVEARIAALLDHENFFMARRAYYHLREQETSGDVGKRLATFYQQHRDRIY